MPELIGIISQAGPLGIAAVVFYFYQDKQRQLEEERKERREKDSLVFQYLPVITQQLEALSDLLETRNG